MTAHDTVPHASFHTIDAMHYFHHCRVLTSAFTRLACSSQDLLKDMGFLNAQMHKQELIMADGGEPLQVWSLKERSTRGRKADLQEIINEEVSFYVHLVTTELRITESRDMDFEELPRTGMHIPVRSLISALGKARNTYHLHMPNYRSLSAVPPLQFPVKVESLTDGKLFFTLNPSADDIMRVESLHFTGSNVINLPPTILAKYTSASTYTTERAALDIVCSVGLFLEEGTGRYLITSSGELKVTP